MQNIHVIIPLSFQSILIFNVCSVFFANESAVFLQLKLTRICYVESRDTIYVLVVSVQYVLAMTDR